MMRHTVATTMALAVLLVPAVPARAGGRDWPFGSALDRARGRALGLLKPDRVEPARLRYRVTATSPRLNRRLTGPTRRFVQGVPAEPVDSMVWDGNGSTPITGKLLIEIDPLANTGFIEAAWTDENGSWTYRQVRFLPPHHHTSGLRIGASAWANQSIINEGTAHNVYLHGDTGAGFPVLPTAFTYLATWGPAEVTLDGVVFANPFEIPKPLWLGHSMVTEGVRRPDGTVRTLSNEIYDPGKAAEGAVEPGDLEAHLTFHDDLFPNTRNVPPPHSFFYHLVFEDVRIEIIQAD